MIQCFLFSVHPKLKQNKSEYRIIQVHRPKSTGFVSYVSNSKSSTMWTVF